MVDQDEILCCYDDYHHDDSGILTNQDTVSHLKILCYHGHVYCLYMGVVEG